jgi:hypothetical protein
MTGGNIVGVVCRFVTGSFRAQNFRRIKTIFFRNNSREKKHAAKNNSFAFPS